MGYIYMNERPAVFVGGRCLWTRMTTMQRWREILISGGREGGERLRFSRVTHYPRVHL